MSEKEKIKRQVDVVKCLGESIGYGHLMSLASALWRKQLEESGVPTDGAFSPTLDMFIDKEILKGVQRERKLYDSFVRY